MRRPLRQTLITDFTMPPVRRPNNNAASNFNPLTTAISYDVELTREFFDKLARQADTEDEEAINRFTELNLSASIEASIKRAEVSFDIPNRTVTIKTPYIIRKEKLRHKLGLGSFIENVRKTGTGITASQMEDRARLLRILEVGTDGDTNCPICLVPNNTSSIMARACRHLMHTTCADNFYEHDAEKPCPICRE